MPDLYVLDVGHGNCAVVVDQQDTVVIDSGRGTQLLKFLTDRGFCRIRALLLSHADSDHIGGAIGLISSGQFTIEAVFLNSDSVKTSKTFEDLLCALENINPRIDLVAELTPSTSKRLSSGLVTFEVLAPSFYLAVKGAGGQDKKQRNITANAMSAVIRLKFDSRSIALLPGDLDAVGLDNLLEDTTDLAADILVYPHHGGHSSSNGANGAEFFRRLCQHVNPRVLVFSIRNNRNAYPKPEILEALKQHTSDLIVVSTQHSEALSQLGNSMSAHACLTNVGNIHIRLAVQQITIEFQRFTDQSGEHPIII
jgi:competence protein ComEC